VPKLLDRSRTGVAVGAAVVFVVALLAVVLADGDDDSGEVRAARVAPTTTTVTDAKGGDEDAGSGEADPEAGSAPADEGTAADEPTDGGAAAPPTTDREVAGTEASAAGTAASPEGARPPRAGTYTYRLESTRDGESDERETDAVIEDLGRGDEGVRRRVTLETEQGTVRNDLSWGARRVLLERTTMQFGPQELDCRWEPAIEQYRLPLGPGQKWEADSRCSTTVLGQPAELRRRTITEVTGQERLTIGGRDVEVWILTSRERTNAKGGSAAQPFDVVWDAESTTWFAPGAGLLVRQESSSTFSMNGGEPQEAHTSLELLSLDPR
jgi:hypothetical protein